jgi:prophage regulatory protein
MDKPEPLVLNAPATAALVGISIPTLYRYIKTGTFPGPIRLGPNRVGWRRKEIESWIDNLAKSG